MGEDEGFVRVTTGEEPAGESPAAGEESQATTPPAGAAAPAATEAAELTGNETDEQIEAHFSSLLGKEIDQNRVEQLSRLSKAARDRAARIAELEAAPTQAPDDGLRYIAQRYGPGFVKKLDELGPAEFAKFLMDEEYGKPAARDGLDMDDPVHRRLAALEDALEERTRLDEERQQADAEKALVDDHRNRVTLAVGKLGDMTDGARKVVMALLDNAAVAAANSQPDGYDLDKIEYAKLARDAHDMLKQALAPTDGNQETPAPVPASDAEPAPPNYDDASETDKEEAHFRKLAQG